MNTVKHPHPIEVSVPGSKSRTNRALLIAALSSGQSVLKGVLFSDDSRHFIQALIDLGFDVDVSALNKVDFPTFGSPTIPALSINNSS